MTVTLDLKPELDRDLRDRAEAAGLSVEEYLTRLVTETVRSSRNEQALALLKRWDDEDATDDPDELDRQRRDWEEFREAMNRHHSSDRKLYP